LKLEIPGRRRDRASAPAPSSADRLFEISLLLMLATAFVTLATTGKLDLLSRVVLAGALVLKLWTHLRRIDLGLAPRTVNRLAIAYVGFYALDLLVISRGASLTDRTLNATVHLVLFTTVIKIFSARTYRDYGYLAALSFLMMLAAAVLTVSSNYLTGFTFYLLFTTTTFISYEIKRSAETAASTDSADSRGAPVIAHNPSLEKALMGMALALAAGIAAAAAALFFVVPRYHTGYLSGVSMQAQNVTGFSEQVSLGDILHIMQSNLVVMRVVGEGDPRQFQGLKWRGIGLTSFDGRHWYNDDTDLVAVPRAGPGRFLLPAEGWARHFRHPVRYRVLLSPLSTDILFAAATPRELTGGLRLLALDETGSIRNPQHENAAASPAGYEVVSETGIPAASDLRRASSDYPASVRFAYLKLPALDPRIGQLAAQIVTTAGNNYDRAAAIERYLRTSFSYTLDPMAIEARDPVGSFLFKSKQGYCEYFASAMAVMLRTQGIPARLVNGFQTGSYNRVGNDFVVRARDAHSWVEVYFPEYGWVPFDPTPPDPRPAVVSSALDDYLDAFGLFWNEWVINYDFAHQVQLAQEIERDSHRARFNLRLRFRLWQWRGELLVRRLEGWAVTHKLLVMAAALSLLIIILLADTLASGGLNRLRFALALRRGNSMLRPNDAALLYHEYLRVLGRKGLRKAPHVTPQEFASSLSDRTLAPFTREFTRLYNALRYGRESVPVERLRSLLEQIRQA
jgi:transglutaminase-like putative cysteine protease